MTIEGTLYRFAPVGTMVRVKAQEELVRRRKALWQEAVALAKEQPGEATKQVLVDAYKIQQRSVITSIEECLAWLVSPEGELFHFGLSLRKFQPSLTETEIAHLYDRATATQLNVFREFQYTAYNPDGADSALHAANYIRMHFAEIPEHLQIHVQALLNMAQRMV